MSNLKVITVLSLIFSSIILVGCSKEIAKEINVAEGNLAIEGYDSVSYFKEKSPLKGKPEFKHVWKKATYNFSSQENLDSFKESPEKYAPQYGGYCAYAMSLDAVSPVDPKVFQVVEGKLYLQHNKKAQDLWVPEKKENITKADGFWSKYPKKSL